MLVNKKKDMTPFDMKRLPMKQKWYLMPLIWAGSWLMTRQFGLQITKKNMQGLKPPYLVISTHQGFSDYYIAPLALFPHRANYVSDMEGFAAFGEWLYRAIGCIGKRRYVSDILVVKNIKYALLKGQSVVVFPESRHSNVGTTAYIPPNMGKLVKKMRVPLVILSAHGSYLANPFWDEEHTRKTPMEARLEGVYTVEEIELLSEQEIQTTIEEKLQYDEYRWQQERQIHITEKKRAEGLHKTLYQCHACETMYEMQSQGTQLFCEKCGAYWELTTLGWLESIKETATKEKEENIQCGGLETVRNEAVVDREKGESGRCETSAYLIQSMEQVNSRKSLEMSEVVADRENEVIGNCRENRIHIPEWYEWQRANVIKEIEAGRYKSCFQVRVEALPNSKGFVELGEGSLTLDAEGFILQVGKESVFLTMPPENLCKRSTITEVKAWQLCCLRRIVAIMCIPGIKNLILHGCSLQGSGGTGGKEINKN